MSTSYVIPNNKQEVVNTSRIIIRTFGLGALKENLYKTGMPIDFGKDNPNETSFLPTYRSYLGSYVFSDLDISPEEGNLPRIQIPTVLFNVTQRKNIVVTPVQGRNGTVKEYISDGDFQINIKGVIAGLNGVYPNAQAQGNSNLVSDLTQVLALAKSLKVNSWYLNQFGITELVVTDYNFPQVEGQYSTQAFEISALSNTPFELNITQ